MGDEFKKYQYFIKLDMSNIKDGTNIEESIENYKKHVKMLEQLREEEYEKKLSLLEENYKVADEVYTIIQERDRLDTLIKLIEARIKERNQTKKEYEKVLKSYDKEKDLFFKELENDIEIKSLKNLEEYNDKLRRIKIFIKRNEDIIALKEKNNSAEIALKDALIEKNANDAANNDLETNLLKFFNENFVIFKDLTETNIEEMASIEKIYAENIRLKESRILKKLNAESRNKPKDKTIKSQLEQERKSLKELKIKHFEIKDRIRMISLSSLIQSACIDYETIKAKREGILSILEERNALIKKYRLQENNKNFYDLGLLVSKQLKEIQNQEKNNKLVKQLREDISKNNQIIEEKEKENEESEYLELSIEFSNSYQTENTKKTEDEMNNYFITPTNEMNKTEQLNNYTTGLSEKQLEAIRQAIHNFKLNERQNSNNENLKGIDFSEEDNQKTSNSVVEKEGEIISLDSFTLPEEKSFTENKLEENELNNLPESSIEPNENKDEQEIEQSKKEEEINLDDLIEPKIFETEEKEDDYDLDSFIPDKEHTLKSDEEDNESKDYNLDQLVDKVINEQDNLFNTEENTKPSSEEGLDALIERVSPQNNQKKQFDEDNVFASVVSVSSLPDKIKNANPRERGGFILKTVIEQLGLKYEESKAKRRTP